MRTRLLAAAAVAAALLATDAVALSPVSAATSPARARYVVLAGDSDVLVYAEAIRRGTIDPANLGSNVNLYALRATGKPISLGTVTPKLRLISLSRSNLVIVNITLHSKRIRWWNFGTGKHGDSATNVRIIGATPDGWIEEDGGFSDGKHVVARPESGGVRDYGTPITPGVDYSVAVGPNGFVAYSDDSVNDNGEVSYTPWSLPVRHRTLVAPGGPSIRCDNVASSYAGCVASGGVTRVVALIALRDGSRTQAGNRCADQLSVWGSRLAWNIAISQHACREGHIGVMTSTAATRLSKLRFDPLAVTAAWGRLVTSTTGQGALVTLTGVRAKPQPLRRARVS
ncbi:MAG: hypothetical protein ACTHK4_07255 [Mycobacteriales bacterium]